MKWRQQKNHHPLVMNVHHEVGNFFNWVFVSIFLETLDFDQDTIDTPSSTKLFTLLRSMNFENYEVN